MALRTFGSDTLNGAWVGDVCSTIGHGREKATTAAEEHRVHVHSSRAVVGAPLFRTRPGARAIASHMWHPGFTERVSHSKTNNMHTHAELVVGSYGGRLDYKWPRDAMKNVPVSIYDLLSAKSPNLILSQHLSAMHPLSHSLRHEIAVNSSPWMQDQCTCSWTSEY